MFVLIVIMTSKGSRVKALSEKQEKYLEDLYGNPKKVGSLGGVKRLFDAVKKENKYKLTLNQIRNWLKKSDTYTLHKPVRRKFQRNTVLASYINYQWDADLADMILLKKYNRNFKYFLLVIDVFSKFIWTAPLKTKTGQEVTDAFKKMLPKTKGLPEKLHTDQGSEFKNKIFQKLLQDHKITHFFTYNELKAMVAERAIKTIKLKLYQYFTESRKLNWIDHLKDVTDTYNATVHHTIKMAPKDVSPLKNAEILRNTYPVTLVEPEPFLFDVNDKVRISFTKAPFERAYNYHWTGEIFIVSERYHKQGIAKYKLKDWDNESVSGAFYNNELQKVDVTEDSTFKIEKILGRRTRNGVREVKVKWYLWPSKFDSWIPQSNVQDYK